jgi:Na+/melibiose symporter-like transporter
LIGYALPGIPLAALTLPLYILLPTFYAQALGLPLAAIGFALFIVRIVDAVGDPLIGTLSDRIGTKIGRRKTWFAASIPVTVVATYALFWPPLDAGTTYLIGWGILLSLGYTMAILPYTAWGAELSADYDGRARISAFREGFILLGTLVAIALPFTLFSLEDADSFHGLAALAVLVAICLPLFGGFMLWRVPEPQNVSTTSVSWKKGLAHMRRNKPFLRLLSAFLLNGFANGLPATLFILFVDARLGAPDLQGPFLFIYFASGLVGIPLFLALARRSSKHRAWSVSMLVACAVFVFALTLGEGDLWQFGAICVLTGLCVGADLSLPASIQADVIDVDTEGSGDQRSGAYFAAWSLATKLALALAAGLAFPILGWLGFNAEDVAASTEVSLGGLVVLYAGIPIVLKLCAVALVWNFPLDREEQGRLASSIRDKADQRSTSTA